MKSDVEIDEKGCREEMSLPQTDRAAYIWSKAHACCVHMNNNIHPESKEAQGS